MKKVLILEKKVDQPISGFDHIFSLRSNQADSFPEDYINQSEIEAIYDDVYAKVCERLRSNKLPDDLFYRNVNLMWCFKREVFYCAYSISLRYETFKRTVENHERSEFYFL